MFQTYEAKLAEVEKMKKMAKQMVQSCEALMFKLEKKEKMLDDLGKLFRAPRMDVLKGKEKKLDYLGQVKARNGVNESLLFGYFKRTYIVVLDDL
jgi:hypothetical protein